jgi:pilus assembly protein Flp/PilA
MKSLVTRFVKDESGATAIEYGLIAGLIAVVIITSVTLLGTNLSSLFGRLAAALTPVAGAGGGGAGTP